MNDTTAQTLRAELMNYAGPVLGTVSCQSCGQEHEAVFTHISQYGPNGGDLCFAVICTADPEAFTDWYTQEVVDLSDDAQAQLSALVAGLTR
jgi:hypothetical protein